MNKMEKYKNHILHIHKQCDILIFLFNLNLKK